MNLTLYAQTSQTLVIPALRDESGNFITGALVKATFYRKPALTVVAASELDHATASEVVGQPGTYAVNIAATFNPSPHGPRYTMLYEVTKGGVTVPFRQPAEVLNLMVI